MAKKYMVPIDMGGLEVQNLNLQNLATAPSHAAGRIYYDTALGYPRVSDGTAWIDIAPGGAIDSEQVQDLVGAMSSSSNTANLTVTYNDAAGTLVFALVPDA